MFGVQVDDIVEPAEVFMAREDQFGHLRCALRDAVHLDLLQLRGSYLVYAPVY